MRSLKAARKKASQMNWNKRINFLIKTLIFTLPHVFLKLPPLSLIISKKLKETFTTYRIQTIKDQIYRKRLKNNTFKDTTNNRNLDFRKYNSKMRKINVKISNLKVNLLSLGVKCQNMRHKLQNINSNNWKFMNSLRK